MGEGSVYDTLTTQCIFPNPNPIYTQCTNTKNRFAATTIQPEFLSGAPGAHLEVLVIDEEVDGAGVGKR